MNRSIFGLSFSRIRLPLLIVVLSGLLISVLPHLIHAWKYGEPAYFADSDDTALYFNYAGYAYQNHPLQLKDPVDLENGGVLYPWIQLMPAVIVAKVFGISPQYIPFLWRIWAGLSISLTAFLFILYITRRPWLTTAISLVFLYDCGQRYGTYLVLQAKTLVNIIVIEKSRSAPAIIKDSPLSWREISSGPYWQVWSRNQQ